MNFRQDSRVTSVSPIQNAVEVCTSLPGKALSWRNINLRQTVFGTRPLLPKSRQLFRFYGQRWSRFHRSITLRCPPNKPKIRLSKPTPIKNILHLPLDAKKGQPEPPLILRSL